MNGSWAYARIQANAIITYFKLCYWPHPLMLDYGRPLAMNFEDYALSGPDLGRSVVLQNLALA